MNEHRMESLGRLSHGIAKKPCQHCAFCQTRVMATPERTGATDAGEAGGGRTSPAAQPPGSFLVSPSLGPKASDLLDEALEPREAIRVRREPFDPVRGLDA